MTLLKYHVFENFTENGAFAPKEQMHHFPYYFQRVIRSGWETPIYFET